MKKELLLPGILFALLFIHASSLGLTDDEAYHWVLSRDPGLGWAYQPPATLWTIALFEKLFGWLFQDIYSPGLLRLPAVFLSALFLFLSLRWLRTAGVPKDKVLVSGIVFLAIPGVFASSWMIVPDLPLITGWILVFHHTWKYCFSEGESDESKDRPENGKEAEWIPLTGMACGAAIAFLSKISGLHIAGSAFLCLLFWAKPDRKLKGTIALATGVLLAMIPFIIWNSQNEWASLLYQLKGRHGSGSFSGLRYMRFWLAQLVLVGPPLLIYGFLIFRRIRKKDEMGKVSKYVLTWALPPALVFCIQPAFSDFKLHWALVVWIPVALELALYASQGHSIRWAKAQVVYGVGLFATVILLCQFPLTSWIIEKTSKEPDPRWDVTNDMYGWTGLREFVEEKLGPEALQLPVLGSRYQTTAQAAFVWKNYENVSRIPRPRGELYDWPMLTDIAKSQGPEWPPLKKRALYVADNRYTEPPKYPDTSCTHIGRKETYRGEYLARWIDVWDCVPRPTSLTGH